MALVAQGWIWDQLECELPPALHEIRSFLEVLSEFDGPLIAALVVARGRGRNEYPVSAMWNAFALQLHLRHGTMQSLLEELSRNSDLARLLGFECTGPNLFRTPEAWVMSRFHKKLNGPEFLPQVAAVFERLTEKLCQENPELGQHTAIDASDVRTHAKPPRRKDSDSLKSAARECGASESTDQESNSKEKDRPNSDPEAGWSIKTKKHSESGEKTLKSKTWGYKLYAAVDQYIPAVLAIDVRPGNTSDFDMVEPVLEQAIILTDGAIETVSLDKGFDSQDVVKETWANGIAAVVPTRDVPESLAEQSREDRETLLDPTGNIGWDRYNGEVVCYDSSGPEPVRQVMTYAGFDADRETHKFRCPATAAGQACPAAELCSAGSAGKHGKQVRIPMEVDPRRFAPIYPHSKRWQRLYNGRSSVERFFGYCKTRLQLENHALRGQAAIELRCYLAAISLNVLTMLRLRQQRLAKTQAAA